MGYDVYDSYRDEWPTALSWETSGSRIRATAETEARPLWVTSTSTDDWQLSDLSRAFDEWMTSIATFMDRHNVERQYNEDKPELEITFDEFMGFEKSEDE